MKNKGIVCCTMNLTRCVALKSRLLAVTLQLYLVALLLGAEAPKLIPFQGRLTNQQGIPYTNGTYTILFQLYEVAVGGSPIWQERHERVGVINGMVNVFLGSISNLNSITFSETRHLGITIDADNNLVTSDAEMIPRQMIIPSFWSKGADLSLLSVNSGKLNGFDWTPLFGANNPNGTLLPARFGDGSIPGAKLVPGSIGSDQILNGTVSSVDIASGGVSSLNLADQAVTMRKMAPRQVGTNVDVGGLALSAVASANVESATLFGFIPELTIKIKTSGRPVCVMLVPAVKVDGTSYIGKNTSPVSQIALVRDGTVLTTVQYQAPVLLLPPSSVQYIDTVEPGDHIYTIRVDNVIVREVRLVAYEL